MRNRSRSRVALSRLAPRSRVCWDDSRKTPGTLFPMSRSTKGSELVGRCRCVPQSALLPRSSSDTSIGLPSPFPAPIFMGTLSARKLQGQPGFAKTFDFRRNYWRLPGTYMTKRAMPWNCSNERGHNRRDNFRRNSRHEPLSDGFCTSQLESLS